ncbi:DUF4179 domain-containing protein [Bacillus sp. S/N-304-OC-R1]|uniref:DUF4179 domain-containing protein n=1 Tax=Bacillus sp. S/N-304-OC-R1 TaxID=2758034 RepID=UPI001C8F0E8F|nr:DUF4179 domain-containing protein [Bacillus sp. S/N-304-OC-R1]MBY0123049.1 DUF4179 domain-containing protein [Bacillus sp. S/N-304-OC-R1]
MNNGLPEFKKEMDKISVPIDKLDQIIVHTIKENGRKKSKRKVGLYSVSAAVVGFGLFMGSAIVSPAMAKVASHIPLVGTFFNESADEGLRIVGQKGLTQIIDQSSKDNGITLTINEVFYDGTRFTIGYTQESLFAFGDIERPTIDVNGKEINFSSSYSGDFITPQKYKGVIDITPTEELPEQFDMKIRIDAVGLIPGKWEFEFQMKQSNTVTVVRPNEVKLINDAEVTIQSLKLGPAGTDLTVGISADKNNQKVDPYSLNFYVVDENGDVLDSVTASGSGETIDGKEKANLQFLYSPLKEGVKKVKIFPYMVPTVENGYEEVAVQLDDATLPITMDQGESGKTIITDIQYENDKTIVSFEVQSDTIIDNHASYNGIWLEDANGKRIWSKDNPMAERIEGNHFRQEFPTEQKRGLQLKTTKLLKIIMFEEFEINIE